MRLIIFTLSIILCIHRYACKCNFKDLVREPEYNIDTAPKNLSVQITALFMSFAEIDDAHNSVTFTLKTYRIWKDDRIKMDSNKQKIIRPLDFERKCIWSPKLIFDSQLLIDYGNKENTYVQFRRVNSSILISSANYAKITITCPEFNFSTFPFDEQFCPLEINPVKRDEFNITGKIENARWEFRKSQLQYEIFSIISKEGNNKTLETKLKFKRYIYPYIR